MKEKLTIQAITEIKDGELVAIASDETTDRVGDKIKVVDWSFKNYLKNPVLQAGHDYRPEFTIGRAKNLRVDGRKVLFNPEFHGITQLSKEVEQMYRKGYLKAWSVGFIPANEDKDSHELLEISSVAVPANPNTLTSIKSLTKEAEKYDEKVVKDIETWVKNTENIEIDEKPYPNFHSCRLRNPDSFKKGSFRTHKRKSKKYNKLYNVIIGKLKKEDTSVDQSYRYSKDTWDVKNARAHCKEHKGTRFEPATEKETKVKGVIPYKNHGKATEDTKWEAGKEVKAASVSDLLIMCAWYDIENREVKSAYKLPHHKAAGTHVAVWNGVKAAMGALLGARGGVDVPSKDRKGIYNHLKKHYKEFDKEVPEFKKYTKKELKELEKNNIITLKKVKKKKIETVVDEVIADIKEGRIISKKNKLIISDAINASTKAIRALENLLELSEPKTPEKAIRPDSTKSRDEQNETKPVKKLNTDNVSIAVLKRIAGLSSNALQKVNKNKN